MSLLKIFCCCGEGRYEEVKLEEEDSGWEFDIGGSTSSDEEYKEMDITMFIESEGYSSCDDDEYYRSYIANAQVPPEARLSLPRSIPRVIDCIKRAQKLSGDCMLSGMIRNDYDNIRRLYEEALASCPLRHKHRIIKEYEAFKEVYMIFWRDTEDYKKADELAQRYWQLAIDDSTEVDIRKENYRIAIMCTPDSKKKSLRKKEYNSFLATTT